MGVTVGRRGAIAVVTLDWPERLNSLGPPDARTLSDALAVGREPDVRGLVLAGGSSAFCSGGDLRQIVELVAEPKENLSDAIYSAYQSMIRTLLDLPVPTAAAVDGLAIGLGMDLALACDMQFIGPTGWFLQGWAKMGLIPGTGGVLLLEHRVPRSMWSILATADRIGPESAAAMGLAELASGSALDSAVDRLTKFEGIPPEALSGYVELSRASLRDSMENHLAHCLRLQVELLRSDHFMARATSALGGTLKS